jgi:hypothetical protein
VESTSLIHVARHALSARRDRMTFRLCHDAATGAIGATHATNANFALRALLP